VLSTTGKLYVGSAKSEGEIWQRWQEKTIPERRKAVTWMQHLKRVFNIGIEKCERCGGHVEVVSCIEDPAVLEKILQHLALKESQMLPFVNEAKAGVRQAKCHCFDSDIANRSRTDFAVIQTAG
jgi:hypothetical protein